MQLLVANQTLGGADLEEEIRRRIDRGQNEFYIVVPMIEPQYEAERSWAVSDEGFAPPPSRSEVADAFEEARIRSEARLRDAISMIRAAGGTADGEVGSSDPVEAVRKVLDERTVDEVIVSTLPTRISRWLKLDLPNRVARLSGVHVVTVQAKTRRQA